MAFHLVSGEEQHPEGKEWATTFPPISDTERLRCAVTCKYGGSKGRMYLTDERVCFERHAKKRSSRIRDPVSLPWCKILFIEESKGIRITTNQIKTFQFKGFQGVKRQQMYECVIDLYEPFRSQSQSLHSAVTTENMPMLNALLQSKRGAWLLSTTNSEGDSALQLSIRTGALDAMRALIHSHQAESVSINQPGRGGDTSLHIACREACKNDAEPLRILLDCPTIDVDAINEDGDSPLHILCGCADTPSSIELLKCILARSTSLNACNTRGETPLHCALMNEKSAGDILDCLISHGANANISRHGAESTLLRAVRVIGREHEVRLLLGAGADPSIRTRPQRRKKPSTRPTRKHSGSSERKHLRGSGGSGIISSPSRKKSGSGIISSPSRKKSSGSGIISSPMKKSGSGIISSPSRKKSSGSGIISSPMKKSGSGIISSPSRKKSGGSGTSSSPLKKSGGSGASSSPLKNISMEIDGDASHLDECLSPAEYAMGMGLDSVARVIQEVTACRVWLNRLSIASLLPYFVQHDLTLETLCDMTMLKFETLLCTLEQRWEDISPSRSFPREMVSQEWVSLRSRKDLRREVLEEGYSFSHVEALTLQRSVTAALCQAKRESIAYQLEHTKSDEMECELQKAMEHSMSVDVIVDFHTLEFCDKIAQGASGKVYRGYLNGREVAVKVLQDGDKSSREDTPSSSIMKELLSECRALSCVTGPNIVEFHGMCTYPSVCIVMEYCSRGSLTELLRDDSFALDWPMMFGFFKQVIQGLHTLHTASPPIVHRDMKSGNVLVAEDYTLRLADFGMARAQASHNMSSQGIMQGTVAFIAPEVISGDGHTMASDIYALGIMLWEMVNKCCSGTYTAPYVGMGFTLDFQVLLAVSERGVRPEIPECPVQVKQLVESLWVTEKDDRPRLKKILKSVKSLCVQYEEEKEEWDAYRSMDG